jgi:hypothetical protein
VENHPFTRDRQRTLHFARERRGKPDRQREA